MDWSAAREAWAVHNRYSPATHGTASLDLYEADALTAMRARWRGESVSEGDKAMRLLVNGALMMSDTRDEFRDHYTAIREAHGRVLIHGLGLGCYLSAILTKPEVEHVDVVELNPDVIALVGPYFTDPRVSIVQGDAFTYKWPAGSIWNCVWHDIWPHKCTDDLAEHSKLMRSFGRRAGWQGCWAHAELVSLKRRGM